jgi:hypothetical protein
LEPVLDETLNLKKGSRTGSWNPKFVKRVQEPVPGNFKFVKWVPEQVPGTKFAKRVPEPVPWNPKF